MPWASSFSRSIPQQPAVTLTKEERTTLETFVHRGKANARTLTRARILLKSADGWSTLALVSAFDVCRASDLDAQKKSGATRLSKQLLCPLKGARPTPCS